LQIIKHGKNDKNFHKKIVKTESFEMHGNRALLGHFAKVIKSGSYEITTLLLIAFQSTTFR